MWEGPGHCGGPTPGQVVLRNTRKLAKQKRAIQQGAFPCGLCFSFCLRVPALASLSDGLQPASQINCFLPRLTWSWCFIAAIKSKLRRIAYSSRKYAHTYSLANIAVLQHDNLLCMLLCAFHFVI